MATMRISPITSVRGLGSTERRPAAMMASRSHQAIFVNIQPSIPAAMPKIPMRAVMTMRTTSNAVVSIIAGEQTHWKGCTTMW